ncbi:MAG TPA: hypothetical protein DEO84_02805 [candidate division Zixibacteria bacterium]|nr:hypothetical protein [candidate division Zixibacteria bacterium]HBZ00229.1 hypothetical protein [candidate division Zixibacteria bacterium]
MILVVIKAREGNKMIKVIFMAAIVGLTNFSSGFAQEQYRKFYLEPCKENQQSWLPLYDNLKTYFCVDSSGVLDSIPYLQIERNFSNYLPKEDPLHECADWVIPFRYWITSIPNLIFMSISSSSCIDSNPYDIVYDSVNDTLYVLNYFSEGQVAELIPPSRFTLSTETLILDYCRLFALMSNPVANNRFISSIEEILMMAEYSAPMYYNLEALKQYENIKLEMPKISGMTLDTLQYGGIKLRDYAKVEVSFNMARNDEIVRICMNFTKGNIIGYDEKILVKILDWHGFRLR